MSSPSTPPQNAVDLRLQKLMRLTGRKNSLETLDPYLVHSNIEDATRNRKHIEKSDKMKKVFGTRPVYAPLSTDGGEQSSSVPSGFASVTKVTKVKNLTGRKMSVDGIHGLLVAETTDQARSNGRLLEKSDKILQVLGQRPPVRLLVSTRSASSVSPATKGDDSQTPSPSGSTTLVPELSPSPMPMVASASETSLASDSMEGVTMSS